MDGPVIDPSESFTRFPNQVTQWAAVRTAARWEKKVAGLLADAAVPVYLPLMSRLSVYREKRREVRVPMFAGYVFCSATDFLGNPAVTPGVRAKISQLLRPPDPEALRAELRSIADLLTDRRLVQERLVGDTGDVVRIVGGPLTGYEGKIVRLKPNKWQVVIEVSFLGARMEVEVDERLVEKGRE